MTDIDLSMDDRFLYVACWGTGEMRLHQRHRACLQRAAISVLREFPVSARSWWARDSALYPSARKFLVLIGYVGVKYRKQKRIDRPNVECIEEFD